MVGIRGLLPYHRPTFECHAAHMPGYLLLFFLVDWLKGTDATIDP